MWTFRWCVRAEQEGRRAQFNGTLLSAQSAAGAGGYDVYSEKKRRDARRAERKAEAGKTD